MNPNWMVWLHKSLMTYVKTELDKLNVPVYFEPQDRGPITQKLDFVEFRWNGPDSREQSKGYWCLEITLNFIINSNTNRQDTYTHKKIVGLVQSILKNNIPVFKDDDTLLGCLQLRVDVKRAIIVSYFGQMQDVEIEQSTVEAMYEMTGNLI